MGGKMKSNKEQKGKALSSESLGFSKARDIEMKEFCFQIFFSVISVETSGNMSS